MRVDFNDVKQKLIEIYRKNPIFNENNIDKEGTVEYKIFNFVLKLQKFFNFSNKNIFNYKKDTSFLH